jgi:hypothetical protein
VLQLCRRSVATPLLDRYPSNEKAARAEWPNAPVLKTGSTPTQATVPAGIYNPAENPLSPDLSVAVGKCPELAELIRVWPSLPEPIRAGILAMVKATGR